MAYRRPGDKPLPELMMVYVGDTCMLQWFNNDALPGERTLIYQYSYLHEL